MTKFIRVTSEDGMQGTIHQKKGKTKSMEVKLDGGQRVTIPIQDLVLQADGTYFLPVNLSTLAASTDLAPQSAAQATLSVVEEVLNVDKQMRVTGRVRLDKVVHEREQIVDEPLWREQVEVERVPINRVLDQPAVLRYEGETMIVPIMREELVVEKRLVLTEEIRITVRRTTVHEPQRITLRSEEASVQRLEPQDPKAT